MVKSDKFWRATGQSNYYIDQSAVVFVRKPHLEAFVEASRWYAKSYCPVVYQNVSLLTTAHGWLIRYSRRLVRMSLSISVAR